MKESRMAIKGKRTKADIEQENAELRSRVSWLETQVANLTAALANKPTPEPVFAGPVKCVRGTGGGICLCPACLTTYGFGIVNACPCGGAHEYPSPWHGITPPPCNKCHQAPPDMTRITCAAPIAAPMMLGTVVPNDMSFMAAPAVGCAGNLMMGWTHVETAGATVTRNDHPSQWLGSSVACGSVVQ